MAKNNGFKSPILDSRYNWIDRPDTKFKEAGLFKSDGIGDGSDPKVMAFMDACRAAAQAAFDELLKDLTPGQKKKWSVYVPYDMEVDNETGEETGNVIFKFRRNARITLKDGTEKTLSIALYDSQNKPFEKIVPVYSGSELRYVGTFRPIKMSSASEAGVRLDFYAVQVVKASEGGGGSPFGDEDKVAGGYSYEDHKDDTSEQSDKPPFEDSTGGDF